MLTVAAINNAKPRDKQFKLYDANGLYLLVKPNGSKYWRMRYKFGGKEKTYACGVFPKVSLKEARKTRDEARSLLDEGRDPQVEKQIKKATANFKSGNTFEAIAREWIGQQSEVWKPVHTQRVTTVFEQDLFPDVGSLPITEIKAPILLVSFRKIENRNALETAQRLSQWTGRVFKYAIQTGRADYNPSQDLSGAIKTRKAKNHSALAREELPEFFQCLDGYDGDPITRLALKFVAHVFVRTSEALGARWDEIQGDHWVIPGSRMKMGTEHVVPLSTQAKSILEEVRQTSGDRDLIFPSPRNPNKQMSTNTLLFGMYRLGYHGRATTHGFRTTASTILNEAGFKPDVIERQLAHLERNKVRGAYNRAEYLEERATMMQWYSDLLDSLREGDNVIPFNINKTLNQISKEN